VPAAPRKQSHNGALRIKLAACREFLAVHGWPDHVRERVADKIHGNSSIAIDLLLEGKDNDHAIYEPPDNANASGAPRPYLRPDEIANWNAGVFHATRNSQMSAWRVDKYGEGGAAARGFRRQLALHTHDGWNFMQHLGDADDCNFVVVGNQFDAGLSHARAAHAEELGAGALAQRGCEARCIHIARGFTGGDEDSRRRHADGVRATRAASIIGRQGLRKSR